MKVYKCQPNITETIVQTVREQYSLTHQREGIHATDLTLCLRVSYWNKTDPLPPSDKSMVYFIRGLGLQDVLLKNLPTEVRTIEGVIMSPDYFKDGELAELKTTMIGQKKLDSHEFPQHWIKQIMTYCYGFEVQSAYLIALSMLGATPPLTYSLEFTEEELWDNWNWLMGRKMALEACLAEGELPPMAELEIKWMCTECSYALRCMSQ